MKADNELTISLLVYFKSVKKMKICVKKKNKKKNDLNKKKQQKKVSYGQRELNPGPSKCKVLCHDNYC